MKCEANACLVELEVGTKRMEPEPKDHHCIWMQLMMIINCFSIIQFLPVQYNSAATSVTMARKEWNGKGKGRERDMVSQSLAAMRSSQFLYLAIFSGVNLYKTL